MRAWIVWGAGVLAYASAVLQRTTFGVAGVQAADRFDAPAGVIALFVVVQLVVYAGLQVPVGVLLDRFGSRAMLTIGALVMAMGQIVMASADSVPVGVVARVLVGAGDAMTFVSAVRLVPAWFPARRAPLLTQLTGLLGQGGQILSALPFAYLLAHRGWDTAFFVAAGVAVAACLAAVAVVRNAPPGVVLRDVAENPDRIRELVVATWRTPGTRLGIWTHFVTCFTPMTFVMMWGVPFLVVGEGRTPAEASALLTLHVLASIPCGPAFGALTQRYPYRRTDLVFLVVAATVLPWLLVLAWPGPAPLWLLALLVVGLAAGGPGSAIGIDFARTFNPGHRLGTATGLVIMGGFVGALVAILLIGVILDLARGAGIAAPLAHSIAMSVQLPMVALGLFGVWRTRRTLRADLAAAGHGLDPLHLAVVRKWRTRRAARP